jgi:hypothetical protein
MLADILGVPLVAVQEATDQETRTRQAEEAHTQDQDRGKMEVHTRVLRLNLMTCGTGCLGKRHSHGALAVVERKDGKTDSRRALRACAGTASIFELLWPAHPGAKVTDRLDGLATVMTEEEIRRIFGDRTGLVKDLLSRRRKLLTREDVKIAPVE